MIDYQEKSARPQAAITKPPFQCYEDADGSTWTEFFRTNDGYLLRFPQLADFEVSQDGNVVTAYPVPGVDAATVEHLYINQLVPLALSRQGRPAFHASVVTVDDGAVAFLGRTGAGKSTLAASFALNGAAFLTDDALLVEEASGGCLAVPSHASIRLWDDSRDELVDERAPRAGPVSYSDKSRLLAGEALNYCSETKRLLAAFVLDQEDNASIQITPMSGLQRYMGWLGNSFLLDIEDHDLLAQHFEWTHRVSDAVPTFGLDYRRNYGILPDVRAAIIDHVRKHG